MLKKKDVNRITVLQKKAVRAICGLHYNVHTADSFAELNLLKFDKLIELETGKLLYRCVNNALPN